MPGRSDGFFRRWFAGGALARRYPGRSGVRQDRDGERGGAVVGVTSLDAGRAVVEHGEGVTPVQRHTADGYLCIVVHPDSVDDWFSGSPVACFACTRRQTAVVLSSAACRLPRLRGVAGARTCSWRFRRLWRSTRQRGWTTEAMRMRQPSVSDAGRRGLNSHFPASKHPPRIQKSNGLLDHRAISEALA